MKFRIFACVAAVAAALLVTGCATQQAHLGEPLKLAPAKALSVHEVLAHPEKYEGKYVRVKGVVVAMCEGSGCWMQIADRKDSDPLFVSFTYDLTTGRIPAEAKGHQAVVEGTVVVAVVSPEQQRHYAAEQGATPEELAKITEPMKEIRVTAPGAVIKGVEIAKPQPCEHEGEEES